MLVPGNLLIPSYKVCFDRALPPSAFHDATVVAGPFAPACDGAAWVDQAGARRNRGIFEFVDGTTGERVQAYLIYPHEVIRV